MAVARPGTSQSLERGLAILSSFTPGRQLIGTSELARELGLTRSTAHRYISTLSGLGYLQQLSDETGFTVNLGILDGTDVVYVERCRTARPGQREIDLNLHVGSRLPAYCTALGKAMLAFLPEHERRALVAESDLVRRGPNTLTERDALLEDLERIRDTGIAVNNEELAYGLRSIATPIRSQSGGVVAAINLAVHRSMVSMEELVVRYAPELTRAAEEIGARIGHR
jgi:IclR family pca regulon transcriptional regulator